MKNLLEAAEDYTKQAGLAGPGRVEVLHVRSGLAAGAGRTAPLAQKGGPGRSGALRSTCIRRRRNSRRWPCGAPQGTEAKRERLAFCCKK